MCQLYVSSPRGVLQHRILTEMLDMKGRHSCLHSVLLVGSLFVGGASAQARNGPLQEYETSGREFTEVQIGGRTVYFHQRTANGAIVEKDFMVYQFDRASDELLDKRMHWRSDLPEGVVPAVARDQAESMAEGAVQFTELYIISPDSDIFPLDPTPENPCWVVRSIKDGETIVTIIDAVTGRHLGVGVPPPQATGFAMSGAMFSEPCDWAWTSWYTEAQDWFEYMGYPTAAAEWPTDDEIRSHVQSAETAVFYEIGHSHLTHGLLFCSGCPDGYSCEDTTAEEIDTWITDYCSMPFTFLASCYGMCDVGPGTLSYAFRKGSSTGTSTVGYCDMSESYCSNCWTYSLMWQTELFENMANGDTVKDAYDKAMAAYPMCAPSEGFCMRFAGDESFAIVPVVSRNTCDGVADPPEPEQPTAVPKNRHISFVPQNSGLQTALRVTLANSGPFPHATGFQWWLGAPFDVSESSGDSGGAPPPSFRGADLQCTPECRDWGAEGVIHVFDDDVVPGTSYEVQAVACEGGLAEESGYSSALSVDTSTWGDVAAVYDGCNVLPGGYTDCWSPPDGDVDFDDVTGIVDKFRNLLGAPRKTRADVAPASPDHIVDFVDIPAEVDAFRGLPYPYQGPNDCP